MKKRNPEKTRATLIKAAAKEFESNGYDSTNSNKIAGTAGYAPQTFYRYFDNKLDIFLAVYAQWTDDGGAGFDSTRNATAAAQYAVTHHRNALNFRRALRHLAIIEPKVRAARAANRLQQINQIRERLPHLAAVETAELMAKLLQVERLVDACAEGEFSDMGIADDQAMAILSKHLTTVFGHHT